MCIRDRSSILAEVFLQHLEKTKILTNNGRYSYKILYWHRYVDDILILYRGSKRQCEKLLMHINKIHKNITFTAEYEHNNTINSLDLSITKLEHRNKFSIYRKPTSADTLIHNSSNHPIQHKLAAFRTMIHRLNNIPLDKKTTKTN